MTKIVAQVKSLKQLAFASSYTPGVADETPLMNVLQSMVCPSIPVFTQFCFHAFISHCYVAIWLQVQQPASSLAW